MLPISQPTAQKPFHGRRDDATLYASLELSQATWLCNVTVARWRENVEVSRPLAVTVQHCSACCGACE